MILFHITDIAGDTAILSGDELRHATKVLRVQQGDHIQMTDGHGMSYECQIQSISKREAVLQIMKKEAITQRIPRLHIAMALTKNMSRFEWFLEKAVEMGIERVTPLICDHSERKHFNAERCRKKVISAATQSLKYHFPTLDELRPLQEILDEATPENTLVAHYQPEQIHLADQLHKDGSYNILIGPEGDFSSKEMSQIKELKLPIVGLSPYRLRTETAGIMACSIFNSVNRSLK